MVKGAFVTYAQNACHHQTHSAGNLITVLFQLGKRIELAGLQVGAHAVEQLHQVSDGHTIAGHNGAHQEAERVLCIHRSPRR